MPTSENSPDLPSSKNLTGRGYRKLLVLVGIVSLGHAAAGLLFALGSVIIVPKIDSSHFNSAEFTKMLETIPQKERGEISQFDFSQMPKIMASTEFKGFFWGMTSLGVVFNLVLCWLGYLLVLARTGSVWPFVFLMFFYFVYVYGVPRAFSSESELALAFGAAWGVGNFGLALMLSTYFWLWGPILALFGKHGIPWKA